ncbi:unnamed protein product [Brugia pahangi]|uniref:Uncharacterized protein n=1 Tax=Brugia pahangi TaxID=6280 RepID=A0A0N4TBS9_BRUPA|nr:unnamed protein product [Brugia pahangi]
MVESKSKKMNVRKRLEYATTTIRGMNVVNNSGIPDVSVTKIDFTIYLLAKLFVDIFRQDMLPKNFHILKFVSNQLLKGNV